MTVNTQKPIVIFRGDNTAAFDLRTIKILLTGDLDLTNATARFDLLDFTKSWTTEEVATGKLSIVFDAAQTKAFALGPQVGTLRLYDMSTGTPRQLTIINKIPFFITNRVCEMDNQSYEAEVCVTSGEVIHVEFNVGVGAVEGKADKVKNATAGDLAGLNAEGNLTDSSIPASDVLRKSQMDSTPTAGSQNPVTSDGIKQAINAATPSDYDAVKSQVQQNTQAITGINAKIPAQASAQNQLADKAFVNSSIQTNTATFRGTYNLVTDLGLTVSATEEQTATAIATHLASLVPPIVPENNDYVFVQVPRETSDPTVVVRYDRYKCTVTEAGGVVTRTWRFEFSLNNSSFTADQWAAINSGITSGDVSKLAGIESGAQVNTIETVKVNGSALTPDENKAVDVTVPVKATTAPVIAGTAAIGNSAKYAAENHVHPAETKVLEYALPDECFPVTYTYDNTDYTVTSNDGLKFIDNGDSVSMYDATTDTGLCYFGSNLKYGDGDLTLKFANTSPTANSWPTLRDYAVYVRDVQVAKDADVLKNSGNQTLDGDLRAKNIEAQRVELYDGGLDAIGLAGNGLRNPNNDNIVVSWPSLGSSDTLALVSQIYSAVQQIAPAWVSGTTYAADAKVSYNGVVYARKTSGSITSSTSPASDTTNWQAKKVSELFLPLTGGEISEDLLISRDLFIEGKIYLSTLFSITKMPSAGFVFTGYIDNAQRKAALPLSNASDSSYAIIAFLQNLAPDYNANSTYALNNLCVRGSKLYHCTTAITTAEAWTAAHWTEATVEDVLAAIRAALDDKAALASPAFTGTPTAPTPTSGDNSTKVATTAFVQAAVSGATPSDYNAVKAQVAANTAKLEVWLSVNPSNGVVSANYDDGQPASE